MKLENSIPRIEGLIVLLFLLAAFLFTYTSFSYIPEFEGHAELLRIVQPGRRMLHIYI